jgi:uncharacterized membrane protein
MNIAFTSSLLILTIIGFFVFVLMVKETSKSNNVKLYAYNFIRTSFVALFILILVYTLFYINLK